MANVSLNRRKELATEAIKALDFGANGSSPHSLKYEPTSLHIKAFNREDTFSSLEFGVTAEGETGARIFCKQCDDGSKNNVWCEHLGEVVKNQYDAVPIYAGQPMTIAVPVIPTLRSWKTVELRLREPLLADQEQGDGYNDPGFPYEAWMVRKDSTGQIRKDYVGMFNKFDGLQNLRKLIFEWIESTEHVRDGTWSSCTKCKMLFVDAVKTDKVLIALESICAACITEMARELHRQQEMKRRSADALARFQADDDLIPSAQHGSSYSAKPVRDTFSVEQAKLRRARRNTEQARADRDFAQSFGQRIQDGWGG